MLFNKLISQNGVASIVLNGFVLTQTVTPPNGGLAYSNTGVYLPGQGARFYRDGKLLGEILDPEFGHAFFAIWLDPKTTGGKLREALLANATPP